jgi:predicted regulator of Ras-like GTPase activity (Roadblock/LC7/MglB family)
MVIIGKGVKHMEEILKSINSIQGVLGSFVCDGRGNVVSASMPAAIDKAILDLVSRTVTQTLSGLAVTHRRKVGELDLVYAQGRFLTKNYGERYLCILCVRNINVPLLNLTVNVASKKLAEMGVEAKAVKVEAAKTAASVLDSRSQFLNAETLSIVSVARERGVILQATGDAAIRIHCTGAAQEGNHLDEQVIQLAGSDKQSAQITQVLESLGFVRERGLGVLRGGRNPRFTHPRKPVTLEIFLDVLRARLQLDFSETLNLYDNTLSLADLLLWKILHTPFDENTMRAIALVVVDHDLGGPGEPEKIDITRIIGLCAADWGWYKMVTDNLEKTAGWAERELGGRADVFQERTRRLIQQIKDAPKSDGWRLRGMFDEEPLI